MEFKVTMLHVLLDWGSRVLARRQFQTLAVACAGCLFLPARSFAAADGMHFEVAYWSIVPFVLMLGAIAILPIVAEHFWHKNLNKAIVSLVLAAPVVGYLCWLHGPTQGASTHGLLRVLEEYASFIILLGALYTISGGIVVDGDIQARPVTNAIFLALGAMLANLIGTTGASMLLIRPVLRLNRERRYSSHIPIFFIIIVSNLGGALTPLGDPPLFLGFLRGVDFFWTLSLWPHWALANGLVLLVFLIWDSLAYWKEPQEARALDIARYHPLRLRGSFNFLFLGGMLVAVLFQSEKVADPVANWLGQFVARPNLNVVKPWGEVIMIGMAILSLLFTHRPLRHANVFKWGAIIEVAVVFAGIFVTMVPALAMLRDHGAELGLTQPWQYFWLTGVLSSFLDNAPTYLVFATVAAGDHDLAWLMENKTLVLKAISCGAVFMGANTYIGNGPNFMVKAIAEDAGYRMPSFFGYMLYSVGVLIPIFVLITVLFFLPP